MKKLILLLTVIALFTTSCEYFNKCNENDQAKDEVVVVEETTIINIAEFDDKVADYVGKVIQVEGTVEHICEHGGKKLFIVGDTSDVRIKIIPNEEVAAFNAELEGEKIVIVGIIEEKIIDEAFLKEWEEEIKAGSDLSDDKGEGVHLDGKIEKGGDHYDSAEEMEKVNKLRTLLQESGNEYLTFYSVLCTSYEVIEENNADTDSTTTN